MELLKFVDKKAILPSSKEVISEETKENVEYAVFAFLLDLILIFPRNNRHPVKLP